MVILPYNTGLGILEFWGKTWNLGKFRVYPLLKRFIDERNN